MKKALVALLTIIILLPTSGIAKKKEKDILGTYTVTGYNPGVQTSGTPSYTGTLTIGRSNGAYALTWTIGPKDEQQTYTGVGVYSDGILAAGFDSKQHGGGVVNYKVKGKVLKGVWAPFTGGPFGYEFAERR